MNPTKYPPRTATSAVWLAVIVAVATWTTSPAVGQRRDRGVNQPGAAGNRR